MPWSGRKTLLLVSLLVAMTAADADLHATEITYADAWSAQGLTVTEERGGGLELVFSIEAWQLNQTAIGEELLHTVALPNAFLPNDAGAPDLPGQGFFVALPNGAAARLEIVDFRTETLSDIDLAPAFRLPLETEDGPLDYTRNPAIYAADAFYPADPIKLGEQRTIRGVESTMLGVTPFQYNPVTRELLVYRDIRLAITFEGGDGTFGEERLRSRWWDPILQSTFLNSASLPQVAYDRQGGSRTPDFEYLIICPEDPAFRAWADTIKVFRTEQGIRTGVMTTAEVGGNSIAAIENFVDAAYADWDVPPAAVLLLGDYGSGTNAIVSPIYNGYCVSDNIFADVDSDHLPEIAFARMTAQTPAQAGHLIRKAIEYERNPPTNAGYYANPIVAGGWQTERWFILCDEVIYGFMSNELGKTPVREYAIYQGTPGSIWSTAPNTNTVVGYFGPSGLGYIPSTPQHLFDWGGNATRINADINAGAFILQHRDHGAETGWGEPDYGNPHLAGLFNPDLTFVFSINCLTGKYNWGSECFAEAFHRHSQGALGLIAASEISYSFVNDTYVWGMFDYFWPDFDPGYGVPGPHQLRPSFANAYGKIYLAASSWPYNTDNKQVTYHLFHHHGDAFTSVYSEMPQDLTVAHDDVLLSGVTEFTVTADAGALIGIARDGEYLGSAVSLGFPVNISIPTQLPGGNAVITVTKQNFYRYRQVIPVVPPEGPYLIQAGATVLDPEGDGDGVLDEAEAAGVDLMLRNVGVEPTSGVRATIASEDPHVTIVAATRRYPNIPAEGEAACVEPFEIAVAGDVPDGHVIVFSFDAIANEGAWSGSFTLDAQAPVLTAGGMAINDSPVQGGDGSGTADAGETFLMSVDLLNVGHSDAASLTGTLSSSDDLVTILQPLSSVAIVPEAGQASMDDFQIEIAPSYPEPGLVSLDLALAGIDGFAANLVYDLAIGGWFDELEQDNGWGVVSTSSSGIWERVDPIGTSYNGNPVQPEDDHTPDPGTVCFVTGNGSPGGAAGENDVDGGTTSLLTPVFHLQGAATATLSYWRWYTNDEGNNPGEDWWRVQVTQDGVNWIDLEATQASNASWQPFVFELTEYVTMTDAVQVRFVAADEGAGSLVEAAVDDILLEYSFPIATDAGDETELPTMTRLGGNYPNPFNPATTIRFELPRRAEVDLAVYDVTGRRIATLVRGTLPGGRHEAVWRGRDAKGNMVASGLYFSRLVSGAETMTRKMLLLK